MVRGRRRDPDAPPSRQLEISRAFRERRAKDLQALREQVAELQEQTHRLQKENIALREENQRLLIVTPAATTLAAVAHSPSSVAPPCSRCRELQTELDCIKFQARTIASGTGCCSRSSPPPSDIKPPPPSQSRLSLVSATRSTSTASSPSYAHTPTPTPFLPPQPSASMVSPVLESKFYPPHPHSLPAGFTPGNSAPPAVQRMWEESVRQSGGDPNKCCAGFFECDANGSIVVGSPPHVSSS